MPLECYIQNENNTIVSVDFETLLHLAKSNQIKAGSHIWTSLDEEWLPVEQWTVSIFDRIVTMPECTCSRHG